MLLGAEEADGVVNKEVALDVVREVTAADELQAGGRTDHLGLWDEIARQRGELAEGYLHGTRREPADVRVGGVREEVLAIGVEGHAPRIRDAQAGGALELTALGRIAEPAAVGAAFDPIGGLDVAMQEGALPHVKGARGVGLEGMDGVVGVVVVESAQDDLTGVGLAVAVRIAQADQVAAL